MQAIKPLVARLWPVLVIAGLLVLAQRLAVDAYWETHPEAKLQAEIQRPVVEKTLIKLRDQRRKAAQADEIDRWMSTNALVETKPTQRN
jgi:hypothetical protein